MGDVTWIVADGRFVAAVWSDKARRVDAEPPCLLP
jgi:hypothetical protein